MALDDCCNTTEINLIVLKQAKQLLTDLIVSIDDRLASMPYNSEIPSVRKDLHRVYCGMLSLDNVAYDGPTAVGSRIWEDAA